MYSARLRFQDRKRNRGRIDRNSDRILSYLAASPTEFAQRRLHSRRSWSFRVGYLAAVVLSAPASRLFGARRVIAPLNWLTRRWAFRIRQRRPSQYGGRYRHQRLANGSGVGRIRLDEEGAPISIEMLWVNGECLRFTEGRTADWVH